MECRKKMCFLRDKKAYTYFLVYKIYCMFAVIKHIIINN